MATNERDIRLFRLLVSGMGLALLAYAALIAWNGEVWVSGKRHGSVLYTGRQALEWAALFACFGTALCGVQWRRRAWMVVWMTGWLAAGVAMVLAPAFL